MKGKSQSGWLWTYSAPQGDVVFEWHISRSREGPREFLKSFCSQLQTDGYGVYESLARERGKELTLIGCWAHARRGLHEALGEGRSAAWLVNQIGKLYAVEKHPRKRKAGPQLRATMRAWQSRPIRARLCQAMEVVRRGVRPEMGVARKTLLLGNPVADRFAGHDHSNTKRAGLVCQPGNSCGCPRMAPCFTRQAKI